MEHDFLSAPPEGAIPTAQDRAPSIKYKNTKGIGEDFADTVTPEWIKEKFGEGRYGFSMYDREEKKNTPFAQFDFIVLEVYAGVSGYDGESVSFWSSRAKDTRTEPLTVYASNHEGPIAKGLYKQIKDALPKGAKYTKFVKAYCLQLKQTVEITLSAMVESAMQKAVAATENSEKKRQDWGRVFILSLAQNDHLWGFHLTGHTTTNIKGEAYDGNGDLFFAPVFKAGIVDPVKNPELHETCVSAQNTERALHEAYKAKYAAEATAEPAPGPTAPTEQPERIQTNIRANHDDEFPLNYAYPENNQPTDAPLPDMEPVGVGSDDLPF